MTRNQQIHYRTRLWPEACAAQKWSLKDEDKRREITLETTGEESTAKLNNKQVDRLFRRLKWLAKPQDFDAAYAEANPEIADEEADRNRILKRISNKAKKAGFTEAYLDEASKFKVRQHGVKNWRDLPREELVNFSRTIHSRDLSKRSAPSVQNTCTESDLPASKMPF